VLGDVPFVLVAQALEIIDRRCVVAKLGYGEKHPERRDRAAGEFERGVFKRALVGSTVTKDDEELRKPGLPVAELRTRPLIG
jgi:hypothetical protein